MTILWGESHNEKEHYGIRACGVCSEIMEEEHWVQTLAGLGILNPSKSKAANVMRSQKRDPL